VTGFQYREDTIPPDPTDGMRPGPSLVSSRLSCSCSPNKGAYCPQGTVLVADVVRRARMVAIGLYSRRALRKAIAKFDDHKVDRTPTPTPRGSAADVLVGEHRRVRSHRFIRRIP